TKARCFDGPGKERNGHDRCSTCSTISSVQHQLGRERCTTPHTNDRRNSPAAVALAGCGWIRTSDRMRERGESVAGARKLAKKRDSGPCRTRRESLADWTPVANRKRDAFAHWRNARRVGRVVGNEGAGCT